MEKFSQTYPMILGRPWLRVEKVKQHQGADSVVLRHGKKKVKMRMVPSEAVSSNCRPLHAKSINMALELEEDEEGEFLRVNSCVIPIFEVGVQHIADRYVLDTPKQVNFKQNLGMKKLLQEEFGVKEEQKWAQIKAEQDFKEYLTKSSIVKQDDLEDINLGSDKKPHMVKVNANLDQAFKSDLQGLLREYKDIFSWHSSFL
ncbi:hypothetical protein GOP47_0011110 [Adiantum capillus-veneris]|uniref:Uncharacterized protein n=1 Tax=Adiantum capillus-veneris TaxID=13818 RepID=A0A9D4USM6_ADICA|nr:hypothetical protein GOP47_0011110 [Adiantum capillus-veneris]